MTIINNIIINIPNDWFVEKNAEVISVFDPNGKGAVTLSFSVAKSNYEFNKDYMINNFNENINKNKIKLEKAIEINVRNSKRMILTGLGKSEDDWLVKIYFISNGKSIVLASYYALEKTKEMKIVDQMIDSINFI